MGTYGQGGTASNTRRVFAVGAKVVGHEHHHSWKILEAPSLRGHQGDLIASGPALVLVLHLPMRCGSRTSGLDTGSDKLCVGRDNVGDTRRPVTTVQSTSLHVCTNPTANLVAASSIPSSST